MGNDPRPAPKRGPSEAAANLGAATSVTQELETYWTAAATALGLDPETVRPVFDELVELYSQAGRAYHNLTHLQAMLGFVDEHAPEVQNIPQVVMAVFFHDAIYDSKAKDNEERSAALVADRMEALGLQREESEVISSLVLSTKKHQPLLPGRDNELFLDADLAILGRSSDVYFRYCDAIREEYAWVPEVDYVAGRKAVLESFLQREKIFFSSSVRARLEPQARENIAAEMKALEGASA
ncbi:MAG: hypothetical protein KDD70_13830 [Bdellovibrionales bacterium]|nr:hypothetical protein [Bdellovibrionales bacterium]